MAKKRGKVVKTAQKCECHQYKRLLLGIFFIVLGLVFFMNSLGISNYLFTELAWPVLVMVLGVGLIVKGFFKCHECGH